MEWKLTDDRPIWSQLSDLVASQIAAGVYGPGERLPSVRELAAEAGVNPNTMQRAKTDLESGAILCTWKWQTWSVAIRLSPAEQREGV